MPSTARLIVMMEKEEKATLEVQAQAAHVSTAEFVRRRLFGRADPQEAALVQVLAELKPIVRRAARVIDANLDEIRTLRERARDAEARVAGRARRELTHDELVALADQLHLVPRGSAATRRTAAGR